MKTGWRNAPLALLDLAETIRTISGAATDIKFLPPHPSIIMEKVENNILETQILKPFVQLRHFGCVLFV